MNEEEIISLTPGEITKIQKYYSDFNNKCAAIMLESTKEKNVTILSKSHHLLADFQTWIEILSDRYETELLKAAHREYQFALLSVIQGQYRQSFMSLRLFLEITLGAVRFSGNEFEFRLWERGEKDINWNQLLDKDNGVLSKSFVRAFFGDIAEEAKSFRTIAEKVYRECSEYVHGNAHTHNLLSDNLEFSEKVYEDWHEKASNIRFVVMFSLCSRYLPALGRENLVRLEPIITDDLGHMDAIQAFLSDTPGS